MEETELNRMIKEIHTAITGTLDGKPGLNDRVRCLEDFRKIFLKKYDALMGFIGTQAGLFLIGSILLYFKLR